MGLDVMYCKSALPERWELEKHILLPFLGICFNCGDDRTWVTSTYKFGSWRKVPIYFTAVRNQFTNTGAVEGSFLPCTVLPLIWKDQ